MTRFGNKTLIETALLKVRSLPDPSQLRQIDGLIALAVFSRPTLDGCYVASYQDTRYPYAMLMKSARTFELYDDTIEFANPLGPGFFLMNEMKVPHFTTRLDDGLRLISDTRWFKWSISFTGLVKCEHGGDDTPFGLTRFHDRLRTQELGLCSVGLQLQLSLHERNIVADLGCNQNVT
jgi:hypothetical protein